jgi:hypothetical protein
MFLSRLIYASRAADSLQPADVERILEISRRNNARVGVTGALLHGDRELLQCLEGGREALNQTYARLLADPRHAEVQLLDYREVSRRWFPDWSMQALPPGLLTRQRLLRYGERELFAPTRLSADNAAALLEDLALELRAAALEPARDSASPVRGSYPDSAGLLRRLRSLRPQLESSKA